MKETQLRMSLNPWLREANFGEIGLLTPRIPCEEPLQVTVSELEVVDDWLLEIVALLIVDGNRRENCRNP